MELSANFNFEQSVEEMMKISPDNAVLEKMLLPYCKIPFPGQYGFRLNFDKSNDAIDYRVLDLPEIKKIFVCREKSWLMTVEFHVPLTPMHLFLRIIPVFFSDKRQNDIVKRCANHANESMELINARNSFITVAHSNAVYQYGVKCTLPDQISVQIPLNQIRLDVEINTKKENLNFSSSQFDLPLVKEQVACTIRCYSSCLGPHYRGRVILIVRLEDMSDPTDLSTINIRGMDRVEVRSSATPTRDYNHCLGSLSCEIREGSRRRLSEPTTTKRHYKRLVLSTISNSTSESLSQDVDSHSKEDLYTTIDGKRVYIVCADSPTMANSLRNFRDSSNATKCSQTQSSSRFSSRLFMESRRAMLAYEHFLVNASSSCVKQRQNEAPQSR